MKCKFKAGKFIGNNVFRLYNQLLCENVSYKHELIVRENSRIETGPLYISLMFKFDFFTKNVDAECDNFMENYKFIEDGVTEKSF